MMSSDTTCIGIDVSKTQFDTASRPIPPDRRWHRRLRVVECRTDADPHRDRSDRRLTPLPVAGINPRQGHDVANATGQLAKTDRVDAAMLAQFGEALRPTPRPAKSEALQALDALVVRRRQLVDLRTMETPRLATFLRHIQASITAHVTWLTSNSPGWTPRFRPPLRPVRRGADDHRHVAQSSPRLGDPGSPSDRRPGRGRPAGSISWPLSRPTRRVGRTILYMSALTAIRWNPVIHAYYERLRAVGKAAKVAITACLRKLLTMLNAMRHHKTRWNADLWKKPASIS